MIYDGIAISMEKDVEDSLTYKSKYTLGLFYMHCDNRKSNNHDRRY